MNEDNMIPVPDVERGKPIPYTTDMVAAIEVRHSKPVELGHSYISPEDVTWCSAPGEACDHVDGTLRQETKLIEFCSVAEHNKALDRAAVRANAMVSNFQSNISWEWDPGRLLTGSERRFLKLGADLCDLRTKVYFARADKVKPLRRLLNESEACDCAEDLDAFWIWLSVETTANPKKNIMAREYFVIVEVAANAYVADPDGVLEELDKLKMSE